MDREMRNREIAVAVTLHYSFENNRDVKYNMYGTGMLKKDRRGREVTLEACNFGMSGITGYNFKYNFQDGTSVIHTGESDTVCPPSIYVVSTSGIGTAQWLPSQMILTGFQYVSSTRGNVEHWKKYNFETTEWETFSLAAPNPEKRKRWKWW